MGLARFLDSVFKPRGAALDEEKASRTAPLIAFASGGRPVWSPRDYAALAREGYLRNPVVYRAVPAGSIQLRSLKDIAPKTSEPAETGSTFEANATIKAVSYAHQTGMLCLADDSGLEIDALGGKPGVISSHYCTDGRETGMTRPQRDAANNQRVLRELEGVPIEHRTARFVCIMALAAPDNPSWIRAFQAPPPPTTKHPPSTDGPVHLVRGVFEGRIGIPPSVPRGAHGFGYDPLFLVGPEFTATSAELSSEEKNARSHRGAAAVEMARLLKQMISG